jgi:hypothetical protein
VAHERVHVTLPSDDKLSVTFHLGVAFGIAIATAGVLALMGVKNRQSGWRRQQSNTVLDILCAWAEANAQMRAMAKAPSPVPPAAQLSMESQLSALHAALTPHAGVSPQFEGAPAPAQHSREKPNEREFIIQPHNQ